MKEVFPGLHVGNQTDYEQHVRIHEHDAIESWAYVLAAKEPWHRQAIGYTGRACDKAHPEYLMTFRRNKLILNLVDAPKAEFFDKRIIDAALDFIDEQLQQRHMSVLIVCNQGESRSPSIAMLYIVSRGIPSIGNNCRASDSLEQCEAEFMKVYPEYNPGDGIRGFMKEHWSEYVG